MKKLKLGLALTGISSLSYAFASDAVTMGELLESTNPLPLLKKEAERNVKNAESLCQQIMAPGFYEISRGAKFGVIKRNELISYCSGTEFEKAKLKPAVRGAKKVEEKPEMPHLRHVEFKKGRNVEEERELLAKAREDMLQNAIALGKKKEVEEKLVKAEAQLHQAQEHYDNLKIAIIGMREDLKEITGFKHFNPHVHDHDSPEAYLEALHGALPKESPVILHGQSLEQLKIATGLLHQANENLASARQDLEKINREMLTFTH